MKLLWILEATDDKSQLEFLALMRQLNMACKWEYIANGRTRADKEWLAWFRRNSYKGRLAVWAGLHLYPECCGLYIISQPAFQFEFQGRDEERQWPQLPSTVLLASGNMPMRADDAVISLGPFDTVEALKKGISRSLTSNIGAKGAYLISDYADGKGQLWPFCDLFMPRDNFSLEPAAHFLNGNTNQLLGTWIGRHTNKNLSRNKENTPFMSFEGMKRFYPPIPSTVDWLMGSNW